MVLNKKMKLKINGKVKTNKHEIYIHRDTFKTTEHLPLYLRESNDTCDELKVAYTNGNLTIECCFTMKEDRVMLETVCLVVNLSILMFFLQTNSFSVSHEIEMAHEYYMRNG